MKAVFAFLAFAGIATLWAMVTDMGTSLMVVFSGLRILRHRRE